MCSTVIKYLSMLLTIALLLGVGTVYAQSSGSFSYGNTGTTHCVLNNDGTGTISGGQICSQQAGASCTTTADCSSGTICFNPTQGKGAGQCVNSTSGGSCTSNSQCTVPGQSCIFPVSGGATGICGVVSGGKCDGGAQFVQAGIKSSSGSGNLFVVRPSAVIGLLTDVTVGSEDDNGTVVNIGTSSALAGVDFGVTVKPLSGQPQPNQIPPFPITYASRFVQISTNLFNVLGTLCTSTAVNQFGGQTAVGCFISFSESTVSAHSFDWLVGAPRADGTGVLSSGNYGITVHWTSSLGNFGVSKSLTCVGPVNLTVQQNKVFSFNTPNTF